MKSTTQLFLTVVFLCLGSRQLFAQGNPGGPRVCFPPPCGLAFQVAPDPIFVGDTLSIDVIIQNIFSGTENTGPDVVARFGYDWDLSVPALLSLIGTPTLTPDLSDPYTDQSAFAVADVLAFAATDPIVEGTGPINTLLTQFSFKALQAGTTVFSIDGSLPDTNGERGFYYVDLNDPIGFSGNVTITVQGVPIPGTALLLAVGLGAAGFGRRRLRRGGLTLSHRCAHNPADGCRVEVEVLCDWTIAVRSSRVRLDNGVVTIGEPF